MNPYFILLIICLSFFSSSAHSIEVSCHRGGNKKAPENTFASALKCLESKGEYVEIDVRSSKDGVLYIIHDSTLDRTTNGHGYVNNQYSFEIDQLDAGSWFSPLFKDQKVPRLTHFMEFMKGKGKVYLDVKQANLNRLIEIVRSSKMTDDSIFWFGDRSKAFEFRKLAPEMKMKINYRFKGDFKLAIDKFKATMIEFSAEKFTKNQVQKAHQLGLNVMAFTNSANISLLKKMIDYDVDVANIDYPFLMRKLIESHDR